MTKGTPVQRLLPWRFGLFLLLTLSVPALIPLLGLAQAVLAGFDIAALGFLLTLPGLFRNCDPQSMRERSAANDANHALTLLLTVATSAVILIAVTLEMSSDPDTKAKVAIIATLLLAWTFSNIVFALHYAHIWYLQDDDADRRGADFPGDSQPGYWDFAYFALTLGMTFQTSDVEITRADWRRIVLAHSVVAFVFNIGIIAFTINSLAR